MRARPGDSHRTGGWSAGGYRRTAAPSAAASSLPQAGGFGSFAQSQPRAVPCCGETLPCSRLFQPALWPDFISQSSQGPLPRSPTSTSRTKPSTGGIGCLLLSDPSYPGWLRGCGWPSYPYPLPTAQVTHKVRSLGMWLKLDTGMVVMLLLFRVLKGTDRPFSTCSARIYQRQDPLLI